MLVGKWPECECAGGHAGRVGQCVRLDATKRVLGGTCRRGNVVRVKRRPNVNGSFLGRSRSLLHSVELQLPRGRDSSRGSGTGSPTVAKRNLFVVFIVWAVVKAAKRTVVIVCGGGSGSVGVVVSV